MSVDTIKEYLYCINLKDDVSCHNFALPGTLGSTLFTNWFAFGSPQPTPLYNLDPALLYSNPFQCLMGAGSPCARTIMLAWYLRNNYKVVNGYGHEVKFSQAQKDQIIFKADLEIAFETERQMNFKEKPSRITSFFLADNSEEGKWTLKEVFGERTIRGFFEPFIMIVKPLSVIFSHKADIRWIDRYVTTNDTENIKAYWEGKASDHPAWEYVVEGMIYPINLDQIKELRAVGTFFNTSSKWWQDIDQLKLKGENWLTKEG